MNMGHTDIKPKNLMIPTTAGGSCCFRGGKIFIFFLWLDDTVQVFIQGMTLLTKMWLGQKTELLELYNLLNDLIKAHTVGEFDTLFYYHF